MEDMEDMCVMAVQYLAFQNLSLNCMISTVCTTPGVMHLTRILCGPVCVCPSDPPSQAGSGTQAAALC
jgi:hypothetical protein